MAYLGNSPQQKFIQKYFYTATAGQTSFSGTDINGLTLSYEDGKYVDVYLNGSKLQLTEDYSASNRSSIVLNSGTQAGDILEIVVQGIFSAADTVSASRGGTFGASVNVSNTLVVTGNVGIGTSSPTTKLDVVGNITSSNTMFAVHFDNVSDITYKENIQPIANSMNILSELNPVSFDWKNTKSRSYGLIAQEVEKVLPTIVHQKGDGIKTVNYIEIIAFLIQAIKEQQQQIDDINNRNNNA